MNALRILFNSDRFNLSKVEQHFINPCCFGEDVAAWLRQKLTERRIETRKAYQEDWGWELPVKSGDHSYYLCVSGNPEGSNVNPNDGEWGIIVEKKRSILQRMTRKGKITENDPLAQAVYEMLSSERSIRDVRFEGR